VKRRERERKKKKYLEIDYSFKNKKRPSSGLLDIPELGTDGESI